MESKAMRPRLPNLSKALDNSPKSQADIARALKVSRATVSRWFSGQGEPDTMERMQKLADELGVTLAYLCDEEDAAHNDRERRLLAKARKVDPSLVAAAEALFDAAIKSRRD